MIEGFDTVLPIVFCLNMYDNKQMVEIKALSKEEKAKEIEVSIRTMTNKIRDGRINFVTIKNSKRKWFLPKQHENNA